MHKIPPDVEIVTWQKVSSGEKTTRVGSSGSLYIFMQPMCGEDFGPPIYFLKFILKNKKKLNRFSTLKIYVLNYWYFICW